MASFFDRIKKTFSKKDDFDVSEHDESYVELNSEGDATKTKVTLRPFVLEDFPDVKPILEALRDGYTIALVNIRPLKDKDLVELKRAVNKLKKTTDALNGDIAGFGEDWIAVVPNFAQIHREGQAPAQVGAKDIDPEMIDE